MDYGLLDVLQSFGDYALCNHNDPIVSGIRDQPSSTEISTSFQPPADGEHLNVADADKFHSDSRFLSPRSSELGFSDILANAACSVDQQPFYNGMSEVSL